WNLGWMHDTLNYLAHDPVFRHYHHNEITFSLMYAFTENFVLPLSHDEVVHGKGSLLGKMPGDEWNKFAGLRALFAYMWAHPGKQLLFMGSEFGQGAEWSADRGVDWWVLGDEHHAGMQQLVTDLNRAYRENPALWALDYSPEGFGWSREPERLRVRRVGSPPKDHRLGSCRQAGPPCRQSGCRRIGQRSRAGRGGRGSGAIRAVSGWAVSGWPVAGWVVSGWAVAGWVVSGWAVAGRVVAGGAGGGEGAAVV